MPTDSTADRTRSLVVSQLAGRRTAVRGAALLLAGLLCGMAAGGCAYRRAIIVEELLVPLSQEAARIPSASDLAAARLARAALVSSAEDSSLEQAFAGFEATPGVSADRRLDALGRDLLNATRDDAVADLEASRRLRRRRGIDPRLAGRLDDRLSADPLAQARLLRRDDWERLFARTFNTIAEPLGQSVITGFFLAPYHLANGVLHYFAEFSNDEPLSTAGRQALALREHFLAAHPGSEAAPQLERLVERDRRKRARTIALRAVRAAEQALDAGQPALARHHARTATTSLEPHADHFGRLRKRAERLEQRAGERLETDAALARRSLEARATAEATRESETLLARALLAGPVDPRALAGPLARHRAAAGPEGDGRIRFVSALAQHEGGFDEPARRTLASLVGRARRDDPMGRHARQLLEDDWQNPWDTYLRLRRAGRRDALAYRLAGEWVNRPRYPNLWSPVAYLLDTPTIAMTIVMAPVRALISPFTGFPDFQRGTAQAGYRYLQRHPAGAHQREVVDWLFDYERSEERPDRALRLADLIPDFPADERAKLVEAAAEQQVGHLDRLDRRDQRASILRGLASEFPDSEGGREAGLRARAELEQASPQRIRITRGFLLENPAVAGDTGLGLHPDLLDGDPRNGELHTDGVTLRGERVVEFALRPEGRDEDAPPETRMRRISKRRLVALTAALDEAVRRNSLIDEGARFASDANRETYLEQARLGLTEKADLRATAESDFVYQSVRERYGAVRGRDSLLPFDLVFRGSLGDFSLGAFPRWRMPAETDDAYLYR